MPAASRIGLSATIICIVVQLGFATRPLWSATASSLTPATTSGTSSCIRQKLVLSTTTAPAATHLGAHSELTLPPAEERIRSSPWIDSSVNSWTSSLDPAKSTLLPAERDEASGLTSEAGNFRSASTSRIVEPTAPVAPAIPTLYSPFGLMAQRVRISRGLLLVLLLLALLLGRRCLLALLLALLLRRGRRWRRRGGRRSRTGRARRRLARAGELHLDRADVAAIEGVSQAREDDRAGEAPLIL